MTDQEWAKVLEIRKRCLDRYKLAQDSGQDSWRRLGVSEPEPHAVESMIFAEVLQWTSELFFDADETEPAPAKVLGVAQLQTQLNEARAEVERLQGESDIWEKHSLVQIVTERNALRAKVERLQLQVRGQDNESARLHRALRCIIKCASVPFMENNPTTLRERLLGCRELAIGAHGDGWDSEIV